MIQSSRIVLHHYRTTFLWYLLLLFIAIGCMILGMTIGFPLLMDLPDEIGTTITLVLGALCGVGLPLLGFLLVLFVPAITTVLDPVRRVVVVEYARPLWKTAKEYPVADIADVQATVVSSDEGSAGYGVVLILKSGQTIRLEYSSTSNKRDREQAAAKIRAQLQGYLS